MKIMIVSSQIKIHHIEKYIEIDECLEVILKWISQLISRVFYSGQKFSQKKSL